MTTTVTLEDDSDEPSMTVELSVTAVSVLLTIERLNLKEKKTKKKSIMSKWIGNCTLTQFYFNN